jgi:hypothetical protein
MAGLNAASDNKSVCPVQVALAQADSILEECGFVDPDSVKPS